MKNFLAIGLVGLLLSQTACSQSQVTITLDLIVTAADAAVSTLQATGQISPVEAALVQTYLTEVTDSVSFATTELASSDSSEVKAAKITANFAKIVAPQLSGAPAAIVSTIGAVASAISNFLTTLTVTTAQLVQYENSFAGAKKTFKINGADKKALKTIATHVTAVKVKLNALPKK